MKPGPERGAAAQPQPSISNGHGSGPAIANGRDHAGATEHASLATTDSGPQHSGSRGAGADGLSASEDLRPLPADSGRPSIDSAGRRRSRASRFTTEAEGDRRQVWSFSSSGWLFCYCFGAVKALKQLGLEDVYTIGSSGGACAGSYLYHDADIDATIEYILKCAATARTSWRACLDIKTYVRGAIKAFATPDLAKKLNGNYEVSVTRLPWLRNHRVRKFRGVADLTDAIVASSCIMPGWPVWLDECGAYCIDGGFSDLQILKGMFLGRSFFSFHLGDAISVCPFYVSRADITPSEFIPMYWAFFPPKDPNQLRRVYDLGYRDTLHWLKQHGHIPYGLMHPGKQEGESLEERPHWWHVLQETAKAAPSCEEGFQEVADSLQGFLRGLAACLVWLLVILELGAAAALTGLAVIISPLLPDVATFDTIRRWQALTGTATSPWLLLKTLPGLGPRIRLSGHPRLASDLRKHSIVFRVFRFLLQ